MLQKSELWYVNYVTINLLLIKYYHTFLTVTILHTSTFNWAQIFVSLFVGLRGLTSLYLKLILTQVHLRWFLSLCIFNISHSSFTSPNFLPITYTIYHLFFFLLIRYMVSYLSIDSRIPFIQNFAMRVQFYYVSWRGKWF